MRASDFFQRLINLEYSVPGGASRVHHAFGDALVVEAHDLLAQMKVFEQRGTARPRMQTNRRSSRFARPDR
jgi:hypothetical protein